MKEDQVLKIAVIAVGGAGCNMLNNIINNFTLNNYNLDLSQDNNFSNTGVSIQFIACNSDASLKTSQAHKKIQLGATGRGAGSDPLVGKEAVEYSAEEIKKALQGFDLVLVLAGFGGGTGTGGAPQIAKIAKEVGAALVVGMATKPFVFEGKKRMEIAQEWLENLKQNTDITVTILNQLLFKLSTETTKFQDAIKVVDYFIKDIIMALVYILSRDGMINVDFADLTSVLSEKQTGVVGLGYGEGPDAANHAVQMATENSLIENTNIKGANNLLVHITSSEAFTLNDLDVIINRLQTSAGDAKLVYGLNIEQTKNDIFDDNENSKWIKLFFIATGLQDPTRQNIEDQIKTNPQSSFETYNNPNYSNQNSTSKIKNSILQNISNRINQNH